MKEPCIQQMQDRMLFSTDIVINRRPVFGSLVEHTFTMVMARKPGVVPGRFHKRIKCISLSNSSRPTIRTARLVPVVHLFDGRPNAFKLHISRQFYRQVFIGHRNRATLVTINNGNRASPVALPRDPPVTQPVVGLSFATILLGQCRGNRLESLIEFKPVIFTRVHQYPTLSKRLEIQVAVSLAAFSWRYDLFDWQAVLLCKLPIPLVMPRY